MRRNVPFCVSRVNGPAQQNSGASLPDPHDPVLVEALKISYFTAPNHLHFDAGTIRHRHTV
jgi:hypothetical protein